MTTKFRTQFRARKGLFRWYVPATQPPALCFGSERGKGKPTGGCPSRATPEPGLRQPPGGPAPQIRGLTVMVGRSGPGLRSHSPPLGRGRPVGGTAALSDVGPTMKEQGPPSGTGSWGIGGPDRTPPPPPSRALLDNSAPLEVGLVGGAPTPPTHPPSGRTTPFPVQTLVQSSPRAFGQSKFFSGDFGTNWLGKKILLPLASPRCRESSLSNTHPNSVKRAYILPKTCFTSVGWSS